MRFEIDFATSSSANTKSASVKSKPLGVIELPASEPSIQCTADIQEQKPIRPNRVKLEAFTIRLAWGFAFAVLLLVVQTLLLVVGGYAGSISSPDLQPKTLSSSLGK